MIDHDWLFSFFFVTKNNRQGSELYFVCFQEAITSDKAHQIIIADSGSDHQRHRKVAYVLNPSTVEKLDEENLEKLCRIAVAQFLSKLPLDNFLAQVLPLDLPGRTWAGPTIPVFPGASVRTDNCEAIPDERSTIGVRGDNAPSTPRHSSSLR